MCNFCLFAMIKTHEMGNKNIMCDRFVYVSDSINIKKESRSAVYNIMERVVKPDVEEQPGRWNAMVS